MSILSMTRCIIGEEGTMAMMLAEQNPERLVRMEPNSVQDWGGQQIVDRAIEGHPLQVRVLETKENDVRNCSGSTGCIE
jgi:hypothetical protein